ncbi:MAG: hypothetical protein H6Q52_3044 [Deltaproteobacteria bacterium]|nr:hypothetical protein [Deltaproteobacteria bacterium]
MKPWKGNAPLAWIAAFAFFIAVSWPHLSEYALPLLGLRNITTPSVGWPLAIVTLLMALFLSFPGLLSRDRLLICAGFSLCLCLVVAFYVSPVAASVFLVIGVNIIRETALPNSARNPDAPKRGTG